MNNKLKILIISNGNFFSTFGGGQVYVKNLIDEMINQEMDIHVFSFVNSNMANTIEKISYRSIRINLICSKDENFIKNSISQLSPDVVHAHSQKALISKISAELSIPCIITAHHGGITCPAGTLLNYKDEICHLPVSQENSLPDVLHNIKGGLFFYPILRRIPLSWRHKLGKILLKLPFIYYITPIGISTLTIDNKQKEWAIIKENVSLMIAPSYAIAENMILNGLPSEKIRVVPHGIPLPILSNQEKERNIVDIRNRTVKFFYMGRISYIKGIHVLLKAFSQLVPASCELHLIGDANNSYGKKLVKKYRQSINIFFHEKISPEKIFSFIKQYDILIHPAIYVEVYGLNIAEALSMGKPVIATRSGGPEMQIQNGENGLLIEPNKVDELSKAIEWMIDHPDVVKSMSIYAPDKVVSIKDHVPALYKIYEDLVTK